MFKSITRNILILSLVSFFNDISSEMLYPIIPLYLSSIGYGSVLIGVLEGFSECLAGLMKMVSGVRSDHYQKRLPYIHLGYALSIFSRPIIGLTQSFGLIITSRGMDRIGKGIRTAARDALLSDEATPETRAEVFGFHRSLDTLGAVLGPLLAIILLYQFNLNFNQIFIISFVPGLITLLMSFLVKESRPTLRTLEKGKLSLREAFGFYRKAPQAYLGLVLILFLFSLFNSSDMFLLLRASQIGYTPIQTLKLYILFNVSYSTFAFIVGKFSNRFGIYNMLMIGLVIYAISYIGLGYFSSGLMIHLLFIFYGLFYAFTQGTIKVLLLQKVGPEQKASAIGFYEGVNSFMLLIANAAMGILCAQISITYALQVIGIVVLLISLFLYVRKRKYS